MDADVNQQLGDILSADPFSFLQFRRWLESKTSDWLLTFWLDAEFYKGIRKQKAKTAFAKQVYGKYVVPPTYRKKLTEEITAEIELKIKAQVIDDDIFVSAQTRIATLLLRYYSRFRKAGVKTKVENNSPYSSPIRSKSVGSIPTSWTSAFEQDELLDYIVKKMFNSHTGIVLHDNKVRWKTISHSFLGSEAVDWILRNVYFKNDRAKALNFGQMILEYNGGTFEIATGGSKSKQPQILKDDSTIYRPIKIYQEKMTKFSSDDFAKQLDISSSEDISPRDTISITQTPTSPVSTTTPGVPPLSISPSTKDGVMVVEIPIEVVMTPKRKNSSLGRAMSFTFGAENDADASEKMPDEILEKLLVDPKVSLLKDLITLGLKKKELDVLARTTVYVYAEAAADIMEPLKQLLLEVVTETDEGLLLRGNDFVSSLMAAYARACAFEWLQQLLLPILDNAGSQYTFTFDENGDIVSKKQNHFLMVMEEVLDIIVGSVASCPIHLRHLLGVFREIVATKIPSALSHVASFLFLRIICPALLNPAEFGLRLAPLHPDRQRLMVVISKFLQQCANTLDKSDASPRLPVQSDRAGKHTLELLLPLYKSSLACFLERLTAIPHYGIPPPLKLPCDKEVKRRAFQSVHSIIHSKKNDIVAAIKQKDEQKGNEVEKLLDLLGTPSPVPELKRSASATTPRKNSFLGTVLRL